MASKKVKVAKYPTMEAYLRPLKNPEKRKMVGRTEEVKLLLSALNRPMISNAMLLGPAGSGKTTLVYGAEDLDPTPNRHYFEVRLPLMASAQGHTDGAVQMASRMTKLVDEVIRYQQETGQELILFMDEIHQIVKISPAAMEAIKPILANSGAWHVKIIGATTYTEYNEYIKPNEALTERFVRISLPELTFDETVEALKGEVRTYMPNEFVDEQLLRRVVTATNQALPAESQPRKSLKIVDAMIGWHKTFKSTFDLKLLAKMMKATIGVDINYQVDVDSVEQKMNHRVFDQTLATRAVADRLYISVAGLNDHTRPRGSFLFAGSTGTGKTELCKTMANVLFGSDDRMIRFDMSEYSEESSVTALRQRMTEQIWEHPSSVVLLDEIEKAAPACTKLMLQVLDDARMSDEHGREVSFKDAYIVFTTNAGAETFSDLQAMYQKQVSDMSDDEVQHEQRKLLKSYMPLIQRALQSKAAQFPPELLGRFDTIVPFSGIAVSTRYKICKVQLDKLKQNVLKEHGVHLHIDSNVNDYIVREHLGANAANAGGGREIRRRIDADVVSKVAEVLVKYPKMKDLRVTVLGHMSWNDKNDNEGTAEIGVGTWDGIDRDWQPKNDNEKVSA